MRILQRYAASARSAAKCADPVPPLYTEKANAAITAAPHAHTPPSLRINMLARSHSHRRPAPYAIKLGRARSLAGVGLYPATWAAIVSALPRELIAQCTARQIACIVDLMRAQHEKGHSAGYADATEQRGNSAHPWPGTG